MQDYDVIVVGAGNAALAAAVSATENGAARVLVLEKAPSDLRGGNTHYSGGLLRFAFDTRRGARAAGAGRREAVRASSRASQPYPRDASATI